MRGFDQSGTGDCVPLRDKLNREENMFAHFEGLIPLFSNSFIPYVKKCMTLAYFKSWVYNTGKKKVQPTCKLFINPGPE